MVVAIVLLIILKFLSQESRNCSGKECFSMKKIPLKKNKQADVLKSVRPSGKGDQNFFELVYELVRQIPKGRATSYGAIAAALGAKSSSRVVGYAMNNAHIVKPKVPAHRVLNRNGMLTGKHHFATPTLMEELLRKEGIEVKDDKVVNWKEVFWEPGST
jgi:methylated-DNA-protein-cysteine methyltransferase-like protein